MSLQIYIAHSGQVLEGDSSRVNSLEALRSWVTQAASIPLAKQVFLTSKGRQVRPQTLLTENEIYVFDSSLLSPPLTNAPQASLSLVDEPVPITTGKPPDIITNQTDLQSWQALFRDRRDWAVNLRTQCASLAAKAQSSMEQQAIIEHSLAVAVMSLQIHTKSAEQKHAAAEAWSEELLKEQEAHINSWEADFRSLGQTPANAAFASFIHFGTVPRAVPSNSVTLQAFLEPSLVRNAAALAKSTMTTFAKRVAELRTSLAAAHGQSEELVNAVQQMNSRSSMDGGEEPSRLMEEVDIIMKKMKSDLDHVSSLPKTPQSVSQASKMALLHTRNYLPNLNEYSAEMNELVRRTVQQRNNTAENAVQHMQSLASIESQLSQAYADIKALDLSPDDQQAFDTLNVVSRLQFVYGSLLTEAVRRQEWLEKMKRADRSIATDMAPPQREEERRRRKWFNSVDDVVRPEMLQGKLLATQDNVQTKDFGWPTVTRQELQDYIDHLTRSQTHDKVVEDLVQAMKVLDAPPKKPIQNTKPFKNGTVQEAGFGGASLVSRGDDGHKALRDANLKLEDELRGSRSRVRKLEDLLHRQTSMSRVSTGDMFRPGIELVSAPDTPRMASPKLSEEVLGHDSLKSRRRSSGIMNEEKRLARRIVSLEVDLQTAKDHNLALEKVAQDRLGADADGKRQIDEANSTKKDIMENMEAQQREFANERRLLEQELSHAKSKIEDFEDEVDRLLGSRDNERTGIDARTRALEAELENARTDAMEALARSKKQSDEMAEVLLRLQEHARALGEQLERAEAANQESGQQVRNLEESARSQRRAQEEQFTILLALHSELSPAAVPPEKNIDLVTAVAALARGSSSTVKDLSEAAAMARSENESLCSQNDAVHAQLAKQKRLQSEADTHLSQARDEARTEKAKVSPLEAQLEDERSQLRMLRSKFADGETGADILRQRAAEEEAKVGQMSVQLASATSRVDSLTADMSRLQEKLDAVQNTADATTERLNQRSLRSKEVSQRMFALNARLSRLLETLGFAISHKDSNMIIERASKVNASMMLVDSGAAPNRLVSLSSPPPTRKTSATADDTNALTFLHWSDATSDADEAARYEAYMQHISLFSADAFSEAIAKRLRDFEYTARKWQKEARSYKEKSHRFHAEGHAKIAVRDFKEGDLALFLPTKGKHMGAWAAFNINAPHHFLREREGMGLGRREWLVARITKVEERVVDLSKTLEPGQASDGRSIGSVSDNLSFEENDNPFELSDGLTWYLVHAAEEKAGAPTTPGLGKSTVAAANVDARGSIRGVKNGSRGVDASKTLNKSLDSRRSSTTSRRSVNGVTLPTVIGGTASSGMDNPVGPARVLSGSSNTRPASLLGTSVPAAGLGIEALSPGPLTDANTNTAAQASVQQREHNDQRHLGNDSHTIVLRSSSKHEQSPNETTTAAAPPSQMSGQDALLRISPTRPPPTFVPRSTSPSKSIRSLARHLESQLPHSAVGTANAADASAASPVKRSPVKVSRHQSQVVQEGQERERDRGRSTPGGGGLWESLWKLDYSLESGGDKGR